MRFFSLLLLLGLLVSCDSKKKESVHTSNSEKVYDLYEPSEMSLLMNEMYDIQEKIKNDILNEIPLEQFPESFLEIHSAELSDFKGRNQNFEAFSHLFVERVEFLFDETSEVSLKQRYNDVVNLCISCHQTECSGPIPRIQKLLIK
jgi:hypothetical protein